MKRWHAYALLLAGALALLWSARRAERSPSIAREPQAVERSDHATADPGDLPSSAASGVREERRSRAAGLGGVGGAVPVPACERDEQCDASMYCNAGACVSDLANGASCTRSSMCEGEHCGRGVCCSGKECCRDVADCPTRYLCRDVAACVGDGIERACRDYACADVGVSDDNQACVGQTALNCGMYRDVRCELHQPVGSCAEACRDASDCRPGNACLGGECRLGCRSDSECDRDHSCINGFCMKDCSQSRPCSPPFSCVPFVDRGSGAERTVSVCVDL
jgi:hypothetical protein